MKHRIIVVECKPDKELVRWILERVKVRAKIYHRAYKGGKGMVFDTVKRRIGVLAIVDEDPETPRHPLYKELKLIYSSKHLNVFVYTKSNNVILELRPRLEGWLLAIINETKQKVIHVRDERFLHAKLSAYPKLVKRILERVCHSKILEELIDNIRKYIKRT